MKKLLILSSALVALCAFGCSDDDDDDNATGPGTTDTLTLVDTLEIVDTVYVEDSTVTPMGLVHGSIYLDPNAYIDEMFILGYGAVPPNIDSMTVGDSLLYGYDFFDYDYDEDYHENFWLVSFDEDGSSYMYQHGEMATINFYGDGMTSTATVKILDASTAAVNIISPPDGEDTVTQSSPVTVTWAAAPGADYYAIWLGYEHYADGDYEYNERYTYTTDTTFTITAAMAPDSLWDFFINIGPFTGPDPSSEVGNVTGDYLTGAVFSFGWGAYIYIHGWYMPPGASSSPAGPSARKRVQPSKTPSGIIEQVYKNAR